MTLVDFLNLLTRTLFSLLALITLVDFLRHRDRARLDIALLFASLSSTLFVELILQFTHQVAPWLTTLSNVSSIAQPYLALRVAQYFHPVPRSFRLGAFAGLAVSWVIILFSPTPTPLLLVLFEVAYFVIVNGYNVFLFVRGAFTTAGVTRQRLRLAAVGTGLLAGLVLLLVLSAIIRGWADSITPPLFFFAIASAVAFFLAFAPPRSLRQYWQLTELYDFMRATVTHFGLNHAQETLKLLCLFAERIAAGSATVALWQPKENIFRVTESGITFAPLNEFPLAGGVVGRAWQTKSAQLETNSGDFGLPVSRFSPDLQIESLFAIPIRTPEHDWGILLVTLRHAPLFGQDDMNLLSLLTGQTAVALDNARLLQEQSSLIGQLQTLNDSLENRVTERTAALESKQAELQQSESRYRELFDSNPQPLWVYDLESLAFLAVNDAAVLHYGYSRQEFMAMTIHGIRPPEELPALIQNLQTRVPPFSSSGPWKHRKKDGTLIDVEISSHQVTFGDRPARLVQANDITLRLRAESELRQAQAETTRLNQVLEQRVLERTTQLEAANKELEAFSYSVSHDLRAPLRHINGYVELVLTNPTLQVNEKGVQHLHIIANAAKRMGTLIDALLDFARIGRAGMRLTRVNLDSILKGIIAEFELETAGREIQWQIEPLPQAYGDPTMLRQVIQNLMANAVKYTAPRVPACIQIGSQTNETEQTFFVRDNGVGFDAAYVDKLFGVFQRLHSDREFEGTGIGLANVRRIIHRHGGRTWAEGAVDQGATFYFTLPLPPSDAAIGDTTI